MGYVRSKEHPGWIYDDAFEDYISPKGRIAERPGAPFKGQLSKEDLDIINKWIDEDNNVEIEEKETEDVTVSGYEVELIKTLKIGDITINFYRGV